MKVIYTKTIADKIIDAKIKAEENRKTIDKIELSLSEARDLRKHCNLFPHEPRLGYMGMFMGVSISVVEEGDY